MRTMRWRRLAAWLSGMCLALTGLCLPMQAAADQSKADGEETVGDPAANGWIPVASTDRLELYTAVEGDGMGTVAVKNKTDQGVWYSNPQNARRIFNPTLPLFSGWNWQPMTLSCATAAVSSLPYSAVASSASPQFVA